MILKGLQKTSLIDYPEKICSTVFVGGCNFRCWFCYNKNLVLNPDNVETIPEKEFFEHLNSKKGLIDAVCVSGGEPTTHSDLPGFIEKIKKLGFIVKLDTNGSNPEMLALLFQKKLLDYVAMDIKSDEKNYEKVVGVKIDVGKIKKSAELIRKSGVDHEFRTTVVPNLFDEKVAENIGKWLKGSKRYFLQKFEVKTGVINPELEKKKNFSDEEIEKFKKILENYLGEVKIR